jgi:hypothetical protein
LDTRVVQVPVSILLDPEPTPSAKVVWMALRLRPNAGPAELEAQTALTRPTVLKGLSTVSNRSSRGPRVKLPGALLAEHAVGAQAKVLYGLLQATPNFRGDCGQFTYASLCSLTRLGRNTLKRAIAELVGAGWLQVTQANRLSPIHFTLGNQEVTRSQVEAAAARRRLRRAKFVGEALMQEYLSLLVDSDQFTNNARPGFLVSPLTGEFLELDRFYPPDLAFEFNGTQHYRATGHLRDLIKAGICLYRGVHLVIIHAEDLSLQGIINKIGQSMPLRSLAGHQPLIDLLEDASLSYRASVQAAKELGE